MSGTSGFGSGNTGFSFGANPTGSSTPLGSKLGGTFGAASTTNAPTGQTTGLFGSSTQGSGLFGSKPADSTQPASGSTATTGQNDNPFGQSKPATGSTTGSTAFGQPAGQSSTTTPFAGFGSANSGFQFGGEKKDDKPAAPAANQTKPDQPSGGLFGASSAKPAFSFGSTTTTTGASSNSGADKPAATGFGAATTTGAAKPSIFGAAAPASNTPAATSGTSTAEKPSFNLGGLGQKDGAAPAAGGFQFGNAGAATKPAFSLGAKTDDKPAEKPAFSLGASAVGATTDKPTLSFGAKTEDKPAFSLGAKSEAAPADKPAFSLGAKTETKSDEKAADKPAFSFGAKPAESTCDKPSESSCDKPTETKPAFSLSTAATTGKEPAKDAANTTVDPAKADITPSVYLRNKSFEDIVSKWTSALTTYTTDFKSEAEEIAKWDRVLVENGSKIADIYGDVVAAEQSQNRIDELLAYVGRQQDDLDSMLSKYEKQLGDAFPENELGRLQPVDQERLETYSLAESLNSRLDGLENSLSSIISEINQANKDVLKIKDEDPITQIVSILNSHLASLQWIDESASKLQDKLSQAYTRKSNVHF